MKVLFFFVRSQETLKQVSINILIKNQAIMQILDKINIQNMFLFESCCDATSVVSNSLEDSAVLMGATDVIVVKHKLGLFRASEFRVSFGPYVSLERTFSPLLYVNDLRVNDISFRLDKKGFISPSSLSSEQIKSLPLKFGLNKGKFVIENTQINLEIYLFADNDKLIVSDVDGTLTKSDIGGHFHNMLDKQYLHEGYADLMQKLVKNGYHIVWLTMRAISLYDYSKGYIRDKTQVNGALLMEPEEFVPSVVNEVLKRTANIKYNMLNKIRLLFTDNPFFCGLGNRENDAIAYLACGIDCSNIYIVDTESVIQQMGNQKKQSLSYTKMSENLTKYFPSYFAPKVGY